MLVGLDTLKEQEQHHYSQHGEDGIIEGIFRLIGTTNKFLVEIAPGTGIENNTLYLLGQGIGWQGLWIGKEPVPYPPARTIVVNEFVTSENVAGFLSDANVPEDLDLLSIDVDGNDYYIWDALGDYTPRVVVIEYNGKIRPDVSWKVDYDPELVWDGTSYQGASLYSLVELGRQKGYVLVACDSYGVNAFFVLESLVGYQLEVLESVALHYVPLALYHGVHIPLSDRIPENYHLTSLRQSE